MEKVPRAERAPAPRAERYYGTANLLADLAAAKGIPTLKSPAEGWKGVQSQDTLIWKGNPNKEAFQQRLRLGFSQGQFGLGEASGRRRAEQEYMSWMLRGVRFPSTARFCVTGWGTGCKLSSPLLSFPLFFFHPLFFLFLSETKERFRLFWFFFFNKGSHPLQVWRCLSLVMLEGDPSTWRIPFQGPTPASQGCFILLRKLSPLGGSPRALRQELAFLRGQAPRKEVLAQIRSEMRRMLGHLPHSRRDAQ